MRQLLLIIFVSQFAIFAKATHILGTRIEYSHIKELKYSISLYIYRDCNECTLSGVNDCGEFDDLFLAVAQTESCQRKNLLRLDVNLIKKTDVTRHCVSEKSQCAANSTLPFGVEEYVYEAEVNFANYLEYEGCMMEFFVQTASRTSSITTGMADESLYNFSLINPWVNDGQNSPHLAQIHSVYIPNNQQLSLYFSAQSDADSISYHLATAFQSFGKPSTYLANFSYLKPFSTRTGTRKHIYDSVYTGFNFDQKSGIVYFTATQASEKGVLVVEIPQFKKINGKFKLIGLIRQDLQLNIINQNVYIPKPNLNKNSFTNCGLDSFEIDFSLPKHLFSSGDTVFLSLSETLTGIRLKDHYLTKDHQNSKIIIANSNNFSAEILLNLELNSCPLKQFFTMPIEINHFPSYDQKDWVLDIIGKTEICTNDTLLLFVNNNGKGKVHWSSYSDDVEGNIFLKEKVNEPFNLFYFQQTPYKNQLCEYKKLLNIKLKDTTVLNYLNEEVFCSNESPINLNNAYINPKKGRWHFNGSDVDNFSLSLGNLDIEKSYELLYNYTNENNCNSRASIDFIVINPISTQFQKVELCRSDFDFNLLENISSKSFIANKNFRWQINGAKTELIETQGLQQLINPSKINSGEYELSFSFLNNNGCFSRDTATLKIFDQYEPQLQDTITICQDQEVNLYEKTSTIRDGFWRSSQEKLLELGNVNVTDCGFFPISYELREYGCVYKKDLFLEIKCKPNASFYPDDTLICENVLPLTIETPYKSSYFQGVDANNQLQLESFNNKMAVIDFYYFNENCKYKSNRNYHLTESPEFNFMNDNFEFCFTDSVSLPFEHYGQVSVLNSPIKFKLFNNELTFYFDSIVQENIIIKCSKPYELCNDKEFSFDLYVRPNPEISDEINRTELCEGTALNLEPVILNGNKIKWVLEGDQNQYYGEDLPISVFLEPDIYSLYLKAQNEFGCKESIELNQFFIVYEKPKATFYSTPDSFISIEKPLLSLFSTTNNMDVSHFWKIPKIEFTNYESDVTIEFPRIEDRYEVLHLVKTDQGCMDTFSKDVVMGRDIIVYIPTAFSPNQEGPSKNDIWKIETQSVSKWFVRVFDRQGRIVFESTDPIEAWNGKFGERSCDKGIYIYHVEAESESGEKYKFQGKVHLLR